jgi:hypothetical protein
VQRDMNAAALPIIEALAQNGEAMDVVISQFSLGSRIDGTLNLYEGLGSRPVNTLDALGLDWWDGRFDGVDDLDDMTNDLLGQRVYVLGSIANAVRGCDAICRMMATAAASLLGLDSIEQVMHGAGDFWAYFDVATTVSPPQRLARWPRYSGARNGTKSWRKLERC